MSPGATAPADPTVTSGVSHWRAPAKLNLFLHVTGRRTDGYHELQTLFQLIDLCDTITISLRADGLIERPVGPAGVAPDARKSRKLVASVDFDSLRPAASTISLW